MSDPTTRSLAAQIAAHDSWANTSNRAARTAKARDALWKRFEQEVDPDGLLDLDERIRRAKHARSAYMSRLALASHASRQRAAELIATAEAAEAEVGELQ